MSGLLGLLIGALAVGGGPAADSRLAEAVVQIGPCSGTLVAADVVLTSAHCLVGPIDHAVVNGKRVRATKCERHPAYQAGLPAHDIGCCRLAETLPGAISIDDGPPPKIGTVVWLAGFGLSSAMSREKPGLRIVTTSVVRQKQERLDVGSATATACRGDSGGPMLIERDGSLRVAGVIHGAHGAICASPTEVVPVSVHRAWLVPRLEHSNSLSERIQHPSRILVGVLLVSAVVVAWYLRRRTVHRGSL